MRLYIILSDVHRQEHLRPRREPSSKRARDGTFFPPFFLLPLSFLSSTLDSVVSGISVSRCRFEMQFARCFCAIQKVNARIRFLDYLILLFARIKRLRIMDRTDGRSRSIPLLFIIRILLSCHPPVFASGS